MTIDTSGSRAPSKTLKRHQHSRQNTDMSSPASRDFQLRPCRHDYNTRNISRVEVSSDQVLPRFGRVSVVFRPRFGRPRRGSLRYTRGTPRVRPSDHAARRARFSRAFLRSDKERIRMAPRSRSAHECSSAAGFDGAGRDRAQRTAAPRRPRVCARADTRRPRAMCTRIGGYTRGWTRSGKRARGAHVGRTRRAPGTLSNPLSRDPEDLSYESTM